MRPIRHQRGAALLMAMIILTLVATLAVSMVWQQWRAVQVEAAERARTQSAWILSGALDWARLILREDAKGSSGVDHLGEPWAVPLAEARLSTFLAADKDNTDSGPEAFLSGSIVDAQSRYNLRNLLDDRGKVIPAELALLQRLLDSAGVASDVAGRIATGLQDALARPESGGNRNPPLMPQTVAQLGWLGIDADALSRMAPYVVLLPRHTPVNLNTAPREVIAASIDGLDLGSAEQLVQVRQRAPFKNLEQAKAQLPGGITLDPRHVGTASSFFEIHGRLRLDDRVLDESSLVERRGLEIVPLSRQRENSREPTG